MRHELRFGADAVLISLPAPLCTVLFALSIVVCRHLHAYCCKLIFCNLGPMAASARCRNDAARVTFWCRCCAHFAASAAMYGTVCVIDCGVSTSACLLLQTNFLQSRADGSQRALSKRCGTSYVLVPMLCSFRCQRRYVWYCLRYRLWCVDICMPIAAN